MSEPLGGDGERYPGAPRWAKVVGVLLAIVVLVFLIMILTRGHGGHGPRRHLPFGHAGGEAVPSSVSRDAPQGHGSGAASDWGWHEKR